MTLDIGRCFERAWEVFLKNWLILIVAGLLFQVLSVVTLFILMGPLTAGLSLLALNALDREDQRVDLDVDNDGPSDDDLETTISDIKTFGSYLHKKNTFIFFGGGGTYHRLRIGVPETPEPE
jgi:hypothetical protein